MLITLVSFMILSLTMVLNTTSQSARSTYIQSSRTLLLSYLLGEMDADRPTYTSLFNDSSMNTVLSESGQVIPYMRKVDTANSNTFSRTVDFYQYTNSTDAVTSPRSMMYITQAAGEFRLRCGSSTGLTDTAGYYWYGDNNTYDATNKVPGYDTASSSTTGSTATDIVNTSGNDDSLFQNYRENTCAGMSCNNINYSFPVTNGSYTVKLFFAEVDATITGSAPHRRLMDIYIENALQNSSAYSPYETTGGTYRANIKIYNVTVSDGVLDISIRKNASTNANARISGISISPRVM